MMADGGELSAPPPSLKREREDDIPPTISTPQNTTGYAPPSSTQSLTKLDLRPGTSPAKSTTSSLSDAPSTIPPVSPAPPPNKKPKKLTFQEKEQERQRKAQEKLEKELAKSRREAEREELKRKADAEREAKKKKLEEEKEERRIAQEAERIAKQKKKERQDAERAAKEEEKRKKGGAQKTLTAFFAKPKMNAQQSLATSGAGQSTVTPPKKKEDLSDYERLFPSFFVHKNVTMAPILRWERDDARLEFVTNSIDKALESWDGDSRRVSSKSKTEKRRAFDAVELFSLPGNDYRQRGRIPRPVPDIIAEMHTASKQSLDSQNTQYKRTRDMLSTIPYKFLQFQEDVRPPYQGTFTRPLVPGLAARLARAPLRRELPEIDYDYDSEAEWVDEPGEDLDSEGEDEDAEGGGDDMDDFLDNTGQDELNKQQEMDMEPISTGLCWENKYGLNMKNGKMNKDVCRYQMEILRDPEDQTSVLPMDPFSSAYWPEEPQQQAPPTIGLMNPPPRLPLSTSKSANVSLGGSSLKSVESADTGADAVAAKAKGRSTTTPAKEKKIIPESELQKFKDIVQNECNEYSKGGLIDALYHKFDKKQTKKALQNTIEVMADRIQGKWVLNDGFPGPS